MSTHTLRLEGVYTVHFYAIIAELLPLAPIAVVDTLSAPRKCCRHKRWFQPGMLSALSCFTL